MNWIKNKFRTLILKKRVKLREIEHVFPKNEIEMSSNGNSKFNMSICAKKFEFAVSFVASEFFMHLDAKMLLYCYDGKQHR